MKTAKKPALGSFYILDGNIYYSTIKNGLPHPELWKQIVLKSGVFDNLVYENKKDLINSPYGCPRGRLDWTGDLKVNEEPNFNDLKGKIILYGTPDCEPYTNKIKSIFGVKNLREGLKVQEEWRTDSHYRTQAQDVSCVKDMLKLVKKEDKEKLRDMYVANLKDTIRTVIKSLKK